MTDENIDPTSDSNLPPPPITAARLSITKLDMEQWLVLPATKYYIEIILGTKVQQLLYEAQLKAEFSEPHFNLIQKQLNQAYILSSMYAIVNDYIKLMSVSK